MKIYLNGKAPFCYHESMFLADLLFPRICLGCGHLGVYLCSKCIGNLPVTKNDRCPYCQRASFFGLTHPGCRKPAGLDGLAGIFYYNNLMKKIIKSIKYRLATDVWKEFCRAIKPEYLNKISFYQRLADEFFLQPVPLHPSRLRKRGFNQAHIISNYFSRHLSYQTVNWLKRIRATTAQAQLKNGQQRYNNVRGAFQTTHNMVADKNIVLIDDVATTGSTLKEAAKALKISGAKTVFALVIAKG